MAEPYKKKSKTNKLITPITRGHDVEELAEDGDFVLDGYTVNLEDTTRFNDDLSLDHNDYEHIQEEYGIQSEDVQPIALDRFIERIGKSRRSSR